MPFAPCILRAKRERVRSAIALDKSGCFPFTEDTTHHFQIVGLTLFKEIEDDGAIETLAFMCCSWYGNKSKSIV
jgi:hypothetical protein